MTNSLLQEAIDAVVDAARQPLLNKLADAFDTIADLADETASSFDVNEDLAEALSKALVREAEYLAEITALIEERDSLLKIVADHFEAEADDDLKPGDRVRFNHCAPSVRDPLNDHEGTYLGQSPLHPEMYVSVRFDGAGERSFILPEELTKLPHREEDEHGFAVGDRVIFRGVAYTGYSGREAEIKRLVPKPGHYYKVLFDGDTEDKYVSPNETRRA